MHGEERPPVLRIPGRSFRTFSGAARHHEAAGTLRGRGVSFFFSVSVFVMRQWLARVPCFFLALERGALIEMLNPSVRAPSLNCPCPRCAGRHFHQEVFIEDSVLGALFGATREEGGNGGTACGSLLFGTCLQVRWVAGVCAVVHYPCGSWVHGGYRCSRHLVARGRILVRACVSTTKICVVDGTAATRQTELTLRDDMPASQRGRGPAPSKAFFSSDRPSQLDLWS